MDDQHDYRGWDLWIENNKVATHLVNQWPENALKVATRGEIPMNAWTHVLITYDGSSQAAGVKIYINGEPQATDIPANQLNNTIRTTVPFKVGQRHSTARLDDVGISDVRIYRQVLSPAQVADLVGASRALALIGRAAGQRSTSERRRAPGVVAEDPRSGLGRPAGQAAGARARGSRDPCAGNGRPRDAGA